MYIFISVVKRLNKVFLIFFHQERNSLSTADKKIRELSRLLSLSSGDDNSLKSADGEPEVLVIYFYICILLPLINFWALAALTFSPSYRPVPPSRAPPQGARYRLPRLPLTPASTGFNEDRHRRFPTPWSIDSVIGHIKR